MTKSGRESSIRLGVDVGGTFTDVALDLGEEGYVC